MLIVMIAALSPSLAHAQADAGDLMHQLVASATQARNLAAQAVGQDERACSNRRRAIDEWRNSETLANRLVTMGHAEVRPMVDQIGNRISENEREYQVACSGRSAPALAVTPPSQEAVMAQLSALDSEVMKALKSEQFHIKAAIKEDAYATSNDQARAGQINGGPAYQTPGSGSHWAACADAQDARKAGNRALQLIEQERAVAARANIGLRDADEQEKAARQAQQWVDRFCR